MKSKNTFSQNFLFSKTIIILWFLSILFVSCLSLLPKINPPVDFKYSDKIWHFLAYCWLSFLPYVGFKNKRRALLGSLLMILLGGGLEFAQSFIPERDTSLFDLVANSIGVIIGIILGNILRRFYSNYFN